MHHVILGTGPAGVIAADTLRQQDANARITLIGGENVPPYSRMAIPYFLSKQIGEKGTYLRQDPDHYNNQGIDMIPMGNGLLESFQNDDPQAVSPDNAFCPGIKGPTVPIRGSNHSFLVQVTVVVQVGYGNSPCQCHIAFTV